MAKYFPGAKISAIHGQAKRINDRTVVAMFHPAAALHQPALRQNIEEDFRKLKQIIASVSNSAATPKPEQKDNDNDAGEQLSLF